MTPSPKPAIRPQTVDLQPDTSTDWVLAEIDPDDDQPDDDDSRGGYHCTRLKPGSDYRTNRTFVRIEGQRCLYCQTWITADETFAAGTRVWLKRHFGYWIIMLVECV